MCKAASNDDASCHKQSFISPLYYLNGINKDKKFDMVTLAQETNKWDGDWTDLS